MPVVEAGTVVGAYRVERLIGAGSVGAVYEATQASLGRTVALRLIGRDDFATPADLARFDEQQRLAAALHHRSLVPLYGAGVWNGGRFVAMRFIRGHTLAELIDRGSPPPAAALDGVGAALAAAHRAGLAHGRVCAENILVEPEGGVYLADLGLAHEGTPDSDLLALDALRARLPANAARGSRGARTAVAAGLAGLAAIAIAAALLTGGGDEPLAAQSLGCSDDPSPNTPACTLAQSALDGDRAEVSRAGVIRRWTVRGASGQVSLQVIRGMEQEATAVGFSQPGQATGGETATFPAEIGVRPGDLIGIRLGPGATVGATDGSPRSRVVRWDGGLTAGTQAVDETIAGVELLLEAEIDYGARVVGPEQIIGDEAADAPRGEVLATTTVALADERAGQVEVVRLPGAIAVDVVRGRRLARLGVPDADPAGEFLSLAQGCGRAGLGGFCLRWQNPGDDLPLQHEYRVRTSGRIELIG